ncbi:MAG: hypothetical protein WKF82_02835 [Nocardioidaceae bacterium]
MTRVIAQWRHEQAKRLVAHAQALPVFDLPGLAELIEQATTAAARSRRPDAGGAGPSEEQAAAVQQEIAQLTDLLWDRLATAVSSHRGVASGGRRCRRARATRPRQHEFAPFCSPSCGPSWWRSRLATDLEIVRIKLDDPAKLRRLDQMTGMLVTLEPQLPDVDERGALAMRDRDLFGGEIRDVLDNVAVVQAMRQARFARQVAASGKGGGDDGDGYASDGPRCAVRRWPASMAARASRSPEATSRSPVTSHSSAGTAMPAWPSPTTGRFQGARPAAVPAGAGLVHC